MIPKKLRWIFIAIILITAIYDFIHGNYFLGTLEITASAILSLLYFVDDKFLK